MKRVKISNNAHRILSTWSEFLKMPRVDVLDYLLQFSASYAEAFTDFLFFRSKSVEVRVYWDEIRYLADSQTLHKALLSLGYRKKMGKKRGKRVRMWVKTLDPIEYVLFRQAGGPLGEIKLFLKKEDGHGREKRIRNCR